MQVVFKMVRGWWKSPRTSWLIHFIYGPGRIIFSIFRTFLILWIFVLLLILKGGYFLYTSCVLGLCTLRLLMICINYQKKMYLERKGRKHYTRKIQGSFHNEAKQAKYTFYLIVVSYMSLADSYLSWVNLYFCDSMEARLLIFLICGCFTHTQHMEIYI